MKTIRSIILFAAAAIGLAFLAYPSTASAAPYRYYHRYGYAGPFYHDYGYYGGNGAYPYPYGLGSGVGGYGLGLGLGGYSMGLGLGYGYSPYGYHVYGNGYPFHYNQIGTYSAPYGYGWY